MSLKVERPTKKTSKTSSTSEHCDQDGRLLREFVERSCKLESGEKVEFQLVLHHAVKGLRSSLLHLTNLYQKFPVNMTEPGKLNKITIIMMQYILMKHIFNSQRRGKYI